MTDTAKLKEAIRGSGLKLSSILKATGIKSYATLRSKVRNQSEFTATEIMALCELLSLDREKCDEIFFAHGAELHSA